MIPWMQPARWMDGRTVAAIAQDSDETSRDETARARSRAIAPVANFSIHWLGGFANRVRESASLARSDNRAETSEPEPRALPSPYLF
jgi:hypothetical protein